MDELLICVVSRTIHVVALLLLVVVVVEDEPASACDEEDGAVAAPLDIVDDADDDIDVAALLSPAAGNGVTAASSPLRGEGRAGSSTSSLRTCMFGSEYSICAALRMNPVGEFNKSLLGSLGSMY